jgi:hypothetical protein
VIQVSDFVDHQHVRDFLTIINEQAARVTAGMTEPGFMTLVRICPNTGNTLPQRFMIGDVDAMTLVAVRDAEAGFNVYVEVRTVRPGLRGRERGSIKDTYAVFALVRDNDTYDAKKTGTTGFDASLVVASSAKASHDWVFLPPGLSVEEVYAIGRGMKARCGGDANTGVITQPYRVAGTPNYPSAKKRGRATGRAHTRRALRRHGVDESAIAGRVPTASQAPATGHSQRSHWRNRRQRQRASERA